MNVRTCIVDLERLHVLLYAPLATDNPQLRQLQKATRFGAAYGVDPARFRELCDKAAGREHSRG